MKTSRRPVRKRLRNLGRLRWSAPVARLPAAFAMPTPSKGSPLVKRMAIGCHHLPSVCRQTQALLQISWRLCKPAARQHSTLDVTAVSAHQATLTETRPLVCPGSTPRRILELQLKLPSAGLIKKQSLNHVRAEDSVRSHFRTRMWTRDLRTSRVRKSDSNRTSQYQDIPDGCPETSACSRLARACALWFC